MKFLVQLQALMTTKARMSLDEFREKNKSILNHDKTDEDAARLHRELLDRERDAKLSKGRNNADLKDKVKAEQRKQRKLEKKAKKKAKKEKRRAEKEEKKRMKKLKKPAAALADGGFSDQPADSDRKHRDDDDKKRKSKKRKHHSSSSSSSTSSSESSDSDNSSDSESDLDAADSLADDAVELDRLKRELQRDEIISSVPTNQTELDASVSAAVQEAKAVAAALQ
jgi:hypothetical protein